jgi:hypothetical protein
MLLLPVNRTSLVRCRDWRAHFSTLAPINIAKVSRIVIFMLITGNSKGIITVQLFLRSTRGSHAQMAMSYSHCFDMPFENCLILVIICVVKSMPKHNI